MKTKEKKKNSAHLVFSPFSTEDVAGVQEKFIQTLVKYDKEDFFQKGKGDWAQIWIEWRQMGVYNQGAGLGVSG